MPITLKITITTLKTFKLPINSKNSYGERKTGNKCNLPITTLNKLRSLNFFFSCRPSKLKRIATLLASNLFMQRRVQTFMLA